MKRGGGLILPTTAFRYTVDFLDPRVTSMPIIFRRAVRFSRSGRMRRPSGYSGPSRWRSGSRLYFRRRSGAGSSVLSGGGPNRVGPPLRSGAITGTSRPLVPRAGTSYPTLVPGPRSNTRELKYIDYSTAITFGSTSSLVNSLNDGLLLASGVNGREGQNTRFMGLRAKVTFQCTIGTVNWAIPSILIVYDKQPEAAIPPATDMFDPDLLSGNVTTFSLPKFGTRDRYKILYWKARAIAPQNNAGGTAELVSDQFRNMSFDLNCNLPVTYRAPNTAGPGQMGLGNVYVVLLNFGSLAPISYSVYIRYLFADVD